jgi:hypothetical protein
MKYIGIPAALVVCAILALPRFATAQTAPAIPPSITTPDKVESRIGTLDFKDGAPSKATLDKVYDEIDSANAQRAFADTLQGCRRQKVEANMLDFFEAAPGEAGKFKLKSPDQLDRGFNPSKLEAEQTAKVDAEAANRRATQA